MDPTSVGGIIGLAILLGLVLTQQCVVCCFRRRQMSSLQEPMLPKHSKVRNVIPLSNEERRTQPHSVRAGTYDKSNNQSSVRGDLLRVSGGRRLVLTLPTVPEV